MRHFALFLCCAALVSVPARAVSAPARTGESPEVQQARQHFKAGEKAFNAGAFDQARKEFEAGYALVPRPGFLLNMAHTERRLGHLGNARDLYKRYLQADPDSQQRDEVLGFITQLTTEIADEDRASGGTQPPPIAGAAAAPASFAAQPPVAPTTWPPASSTAVAPLTPLTPPASLPFAETIRPAESTQLLVAPAPDRLEKERDRESAGRPLYKKWWFWGGLGAIAAGATLGVVFATRDGGPAFHDTGSLGSLGNP